MGAKAENFLSLDPNAKDKRRSSPSLRRPSTLFPANSSILWTQPLAAKGIECREVSAWAPSHPQPLVRRQAVGGEAGLDCPGSSQSLQALRGLSLSLGNFGHRTSRGQGLPNSPILKKKEADAGCWQRPNRHSALRISFFFAKFWELGPAGRGWEAVEPRFGQLTA